MAKTSLDSHEFFNFTSGHWLYNEEARLRERHIKFNVEALQRVAANAAGAKRVNAMRKLPEGTYNKAFLLDLDNGDQVVARIPNPNAGPPAVITASEVATMKFANSVLDIPVPTVLAWSTQDEAKQGVGADFIIMRPARGVELSVIWEKLDFEAKLEVIKELVFIEAKFHAAKLPAYGSVYYADELRRISPVGLRNGIPVPDSPFTVGPSADLSFWHNKRSNLEVDKGPCKPLSSYGDGC